MTSSAKALLAFAGGAIAGWFAAKYFYKEKYRKIAEEEIDSVIKEFEDSSEEPVADISSEEANKVPAQEADVVAPTDAELDKAFEAVPEYHDYTQYTARANVRPKKKPKEAEPYKIKIVDYKEFASDPTYEVSTLTYYTNDVLANEDDEVILERDMTVGEESLGLISSGTAEVVYVRNDTFKTFYEICASDTTYEEATGCSSID